MLGGLHNVSPKQQGLGPGGGLCAAALLVWLGIQRVEVCTAARERASGSGGTGQYKRRLGLRCAVWPGRRRAQPDKTTASRAAGSSFESLA
jgi:hypothetical protein